MVANPQSRNHVVCPTCKGVTTVIKTVPGSVRRKHDVPCMACRALGIDDSERVCQYCDNWRDLCTCRAGVHSVFTPQRLKRPAPPRPAWLRLVSDNSQSSECLPTENSVATDMPSADLELDAPIDDNSAISCNRHMCELKLLFDNFYFCRRCGHAQEG